MTGNHHGSSVESQKFGLEIIKHLRQKTDAFSREYDLNFALIATPGEGLAGRFPPMDRDEFGEIPGVNTRKYYTNSFHVPVYFKIEAFNKIDIEAPYHEFCNGGHITYVELDGDPSYNIDGFEAVVCHMKDAGVGYGSINHPVDRDPVCGYNGIIAGDICPSCGRKEENGSGFERLRRITGYLVGTLERWNDAKQAEEKDRVKHGISGCDDKR
jgi:ribonucleoside-triphosphate reductase